MFLSSSAVMTVPSDCFSLLYRMVQPKSIFITRHALLEFYFSLTQTCLDFVYLIQLCVSNAYLFLISVGQN